MRRNQSGMTLISFVIVAAVVGFFLYIAMKIFPMYQEFYAVKSALKGMAGEGVGNEEPAQLKERLFRRLDISFSSNVKPENVKIEGRGSSKTIKVNYEVRVPLVANLDIVGRFDAEQVLTGGSSP